MLLALVWIIVVTGVQLAASKIGHRHGVLSSTVAAVAVGVFLVQLYDLHLRERIYYLTHKEALLTQLHIPTETDQPTLAAVQISESSFSLNSAFALIVFDSSDQIALPLEDRTTDWFDRARRSQILLVASDCHLGADRVDTHIYFVNGSCY